ncbi:heparinase II/III domain-containing protein [Propionibacteriaceae bacterium Y2011]
MSTAEHPKLSAAPTSRFSADLSRRRLLQAGGLGAAAVGLGGGAAGGLGGGSAHAAPEQLSAVKSRTVYYSAEKIAAARENIANFAWAREIADAEIARADKLVALDPETLWASVTTQGLPRSYAVNQLLGSPVTGTDIYEYGNYPWLADPFTKPYQMVDPSSDHVFPTNDFASFYASALDEHGNFDRDLGDPQYLVNIRHPERGPDWGVDDGYGWVDENGDKWTFIAYYNHWFTWLNPDSLLDAPVLSAARAYAYTGDLKYARAGLIALDRIADVYPSMDRSAHPKSEGYLASDGGTGLGNVVGSIWETGLVKHLCEAYEAFYPAIADEDLAGVLPFLQAKSEQYGLNPKATTADVRANIEHGILRQVFPSVKEARIRGNFGAHQSALAFAAVVLDDPVDSKEWLEFVFQAGAFLSNPYRITGGNVYPVILGDVDRDGFGNESGPGYNYGWIGQIGQIADLLAGYDLFPTADLYQHPTVRRMVLARGPLTMLNSYTPPIGDSGSTGKPGLFGSPTTYTQAFAQYGEVESAQLAYLMNDESAAGLNAGIFTLDTAALQAEIEAIVTSKGSLALPSMNLSGFGMALLRDGADDAARGFSVYYGRTIGHAHRDALNLEMWSNGVDVMPDQGYPEFADNSIRRHEWTDNTVAHNTVVVDSSPQLQQYAPGRPLAWADAENVKFVDVDASSAYEQTGTYRRTTAMIRIDADRAYLVDVFRVVGGDRHDYSFHGAEGPVTPTGLALVPQDGGTYAGADVPQPPDDATADPNASGFDWLINVSRDSDPGAQFSLDYDVVDTWDVHESDPNLHLRATFLADFDEVALADGEPPRNKPGNPKTLRYLLGRRSGTDLTTTVNAVFEPYVDASAITKISSVTPTAEVEVSSDEVSVIKIELTDGRVDYVVHSLRPEVELDIDGVFKFSGVFGVYSLVAGKGQWAFTSEAAKLNPKDTATGAVATLQADPPAFTGTLTGFTSDLDREEPGPDSTSELVVSVGDVDLAAAAEEVVGLEVHVANDGVRTATYRIVEATVDGSGLRLGLGRTTLVREMADPDDLEGGYVYDVAQGQAVRVPRQRSWHR